MSQETILKILDIERKAVQNYEEAQRQATDLVEEARASAAASREQVLTQARQQAAQIAQESRERIERERERIIEQAKAEIQQKEALAEQHLEQATSFVLDRILGLE